MKATKITVEVTISADKKKVWKFWTTPEHVINWNFASDDWQCPKAMNDLKTGGKFSYRMEAKDQSAGFDFEGTYDEVVDQKKITYSMPDGRQTTIDFENVNDKTKVTETFDAEDIHSIEMQKTGWQTILDNFKKYVEAN